MTKNTSNLVVAKRLWHGGRFYENGTAFADLNPTPTSSEQALYEDGGFLMDADELEKQRDAKAYELKQAARENASEVERLTRELEDLRRLYAALGDDVDSTESAMEQIKTLTATANRTNDAVGDKVLSEGLRSLYPDATTPDALLTSVKDTHARAAALEKLHAIEGGTPLPTNIVGRKGLVALGLDTWESLRGKTVAQLDAVEGLSAEQAGKLVDLVERHFANPTE